MISSASVTDRKSRCGQDISPDRAWTADDIPDHVNEAARFADHTKQWDSRILASGSARARRYG